jgi:hypothetical protein
MYADSTGWLLPMMCNSNLNSLTLYIHPLTQTPLTDFVFFCLLQRVQRVRWHSQVNDPTDDDARLPGPAHPVHGLQQQCGL